MCIRDRNNLISKNKDLSLAAPSVRPRGLVKSTTKTFTTPPEFFHCFFFFLSQDFHQNFHHTPRIFPLLFFLSFPGLPSKLLPHPQNFSIPFFSFFPRNSIKTYTPPEFCRLITKLQTPLWKILFLIPGVDLKKTILSISLYFVCRSFLKSYNDIYKIWILKKFFTIFLWVVEL